MTGLGARRYRFRGPHRRCALLEIQPVQDARSHRDFCELPYRLYRRERAWVPPLRADEHRRWSPRSNPALRHRWTSRFLARRDGRVAGRIAAVVDPEFCARWQDGAGFFGFFESEDDPAVARALLDAAESALAARGMSAVLGPVNLSTHEDVGLLVEGFAVPPMVLTPYHLPYYEALITDAGYQPRLDYHAYRKDPMTDPAPVVERVLRAARTGNGLVVRPTIPARWDAENRIVLDLYNRSFAGMWGFVPMTWDEYMDKARSFRPFYRPELTLVAEWDGRPVGFAIALPDVNVALARAKGRLWPLGWFHLMRALPRIRSVRVLLLGVLPEFLGRGIAAVLAAELTAASRRLGMREAELSLVQATNDRIGSVIRAFGGVPGKTYRLYEKALSH